MENQTKNKFLSVFLAVFMVLALFISIGQAITIKSHFTLRIGGTSAAMDSLDGANLSDGDECRIHLSGNLFEIWILDADSGLSESVSAGVVAPDDNPGSKRWIRYNFNTSTEKAALDYGNAFTDTTLNAAITDIGSDHWTLLINRGTWVIDDPNDVTFHANTCLKFEEGAVFDINDYGVAVTINGDIDAGLYQVFDVDANSTLTMPNVTDIYTAWFNNDLDDAVGAISSINQLLHINDSTLNSSIAIAKDICIILDCDSTSTLSNSAIFDIDGTLSGTTYTLSADEDEGSESVVVTSATGLADGDYIYFYQPLSTGYVDSHYRIAGLSGTTITLDRDLDIDANSVNCVIYEHTPYRFSFDGNGKTIEMDGNQPKFISMLYGRDSKISNIDMIFSGTEGQASSAVIKPIFVDRCYGITVENVTFKNLKGGSEFSCMGVYRSSGIDIDNVFIPGTKGKAGGMVFLYNTQGDIHNCKLYKVAAGTGVIYSYCCSYFNINNNIIHSSTYNGADASASGIQITACTNINCTGNTVANCRGIGEIYVSGSSDRVNIVANSISHSGVGTSNYSSAIHLRSGTNIKCDSNLIETDGAAGIQLRGIDEYSLCNNEVICTGTNGILLIKAGSDSDTAAYYPSDGIVSGNKIKLTNSESTCKAFSLGSKAYGNKICNNKIQFESSASASGNKWGVIIYATDDQTEVHDNYLFASASDANYSVLGVQLSSFAGSFYDNMADGDNCTEYTFTTCTGHGWNNVDIESGWVYNYIAGDSYYKGIESLCAQISGTTAARPTLDATYDKGFGYWDTDLSKMVFWDGSAWKYADGNTP